MLSYRKNVSYHCNSITDNCNLITALLCNHYPQHWWWWDVWSRRSGSVTCLDCFLPHSVVLLSNGTLLITQVKPRNTGTYKCVGRGLRGSHVTLEASLLIAGTHTHTFAVVELVRDKHLWNLCNLRLRGHLDYILILPPPSHSALPTSSSGSFT